MFRLTRPSFFRVLTLCLALLGGARVAAWMDGDASPDTRDVPSAARAGALALTASDSMAGEAERSIAARPTDSRRLRRLSWRRPSGRRFGRDLLTRGVLAVPVGSNQSAYALSEDEDAIVGDERLSLAGVIERTAGPPRAPPALS